jgi:hypothetical protein
MLRRLFTVSVFFAVLSVLHGQSTANPLAQLDNAVKGLGAEINSRLSAEKAGKVTLGQWTYRNSAAPLGTYWQLQLMEELTNIPGRSFLLVPGPQAGADWTISGEIIQIAGVVRIYTRFLRATGNSVTAILHSDFEYNQHFAEMLSGGGPSSSGAADPYEADSWDYPFPMEIASSAGIPGVARTLHDDEDEDFFLLAPGRDGPLVMETTGNMDTYLEFYRADDSRNTIDDNDDGGSSGNARLRYNVSAGERYIVKIRGYSGDTGSYTFRAYIAESVHLNPDEYEDDNEFEAARDIEIGVSQQHTFHNGGDTDWVKFRVSRPGRYTIRTRGLNSPSLDTYIELYDSEHNSVDSDDDGGDDMDSLLSVQLQNGTYYLQVECLDDNVEQPYTIRVDAE